MTLRGRPYRHPYRHPYRRPYGPPYRRPYRRRCRRRYGRPYGCPYGRPCGRPYGRFRQQDAKTSAADDNNHMLSLIKTQSITLIFYLTLPSTLRVLITCAVQDELHSSSDLHPKLENLTEVSGEAQEVPPSGPHHSPRRGFRALDASHLSCAAHLGQHASLVFFFLFM